MKKSFSTNTSTILCGDARLRGVPEMEEAMTFDELYRLVLRRRLRGESVEFSGRHARKKLDCLLHPEKYPLIWKENPCDCSDAKCVTACMFRALEIRDGEVVLNPENCVGCARCVEACRNKNLTFSRDAVKAVEILKTQDKPVYALMAPAYVGQPSWRAFATRPAAIIGDTEAGRCPAIFAKSFRIMEIQIGQQQLVS